MHFSGNSPIPPCAEYDPEIKQYRVHGGGRWTLTGLTTDPERVTCPRCLETVADAVADALIELPMTVTGRDLDRMAGLYTLSRKLGESDLAFQQRLLDAVADDMLGGGG